MTTATVDDADTLHEQIMRFAALGEPGPDPPGARKPSVFDFGTAGFAGFDDATLEAVVTAMRNDARAVYEALSRWVRLIRARRALGRKSERKAAKESGVSRATMRKATTAAKRK